MGHPCNKVNRAQLSGVSSIMAMSMVIMSSAIIVAAADKGARHHVLAVSHPKDISHQLQSRFQRSPQPSSNGASVTSICDGLCNCTKEKEIFLNVACDFTQNKVSSRSSSRLEPNQICNSIRQEIHGLFVTDAN